MRRIGSVTALTLAALAPSVAQGETTTVLMPGKAFSPARSTIVAGDVVVFTNTDFVTHDVRLAGGEVYSGPITYSKSWSQQFDRPGGYPYVCTLHVGMSGNLDVLAATLGATPRTLLEGEPVTLSGRAPAGTALVRVEQSVAGGAWTAVGTGAAPAPDGGFETTVPAVTGASYRVTTPAGASRPVTPRVQAAFDVRVTVKRKRRHTAVRVHTVPAAKGLVARLELYSRWRYRWRPQRRSRLDAEGRAGFRLPASRRTYARVTASRGGRVLARSDVISLRTGRVAGDPDAIVPHGGGHGGHG